MQQTTRHRYTVAGALSVMAAVGLARLGIASSGLPAPRQSDSLLCQWQRVPAELPPRFHAAGVIDPVAGHLYYYGGLGSNGKTSNAVDVVDLSAPNLMDASVSICAFDGPQPEKRWGHDGAYRGSDDGPGEIYWIAGQSRDHFEPSPTPSLQLPPRPTRTRTPTPRPT